jgi:demethylmenaquinone methyltransferase/2-methoxy-6-polyprenyl-1,4-benzoquinol methylase
MVLARGQSSVPKTTSPHPVLKKYYDDATKRQPFVTSLFDAGAKYYDWICDLGSFGTNRFYRNWVLRTSGLRRGMTLLDVATGTGLMARSAARILRDPRAVIGLDPSRGMLQEARATVAVRLVQGGAEALPFSADRFDFVSMGYALRHVADLEATFDECLRVLKPGGRLLVLDMSRPETAALRWILRVHLQTVLPLIMRLGTRSGPAQLMTRYYWDTIAECVPPETILDVLRASGFADVQRHVRGGFLSEYLAVKPGRHSADRHPGRFDTA